MMSDSDNAFAGFVLGAAVGDSLGLPREGLSARRARKIFGPAPLRHRFCLGHGCFSDDTEHLVFTALAVLEEDADPDRFGRSLARSLKYWLLRLPAGVGLATARSILRLWLGWPPDRSGVFSAGNGPAMRSGMLGLCLHRDPDRLRQFVRAATRLTHTDPKAETGALAVAWSARFAFLQPITPETSPKLLEELRSLTAEREWQELLTRISAALEAGESPADFAVRIGVRSGVRGYIYETVAVALFCWLRTPHDFRQSLEQAILLGGDTDTVGAIVGGLAGITNGAEGIPADWIIHLADWPLTANWLRILAASLQARFDRQERAVIPPRFPAWMTVPRNLLFLALVLAHGFRRLLPPY